MSKRRRPVETQTNIGELLQTETTWSSGAIALAPVQRRRIDRTIGRERVRAEPPLAVAYRLAERVPQNVELYFIFDIVAAKVRAVRSCKSMVVNGHGVRVNPVARQVATELSDEYCPSQAASRPGSSPGRSPFAFIS